MDRHPVWTEWQRASLYSMLAGFYRELEPGTSLSYATLHQEAMQRLAVLAHKYGYPPEHPSSGPAAYGETAFLGSSFFPAAESFPLPGLEPDSQWMQYGPAAGAGWPVSSGPLTPSSWQPIQALPGLAPAAPPTGSGTAAPGMPHPAMAWPQDMPLPLPATSMPWQNFGSSTFHDYVTPYGFVPVSSTGTAASGFSPVASTDAASYEFSPVASFGSGDSFQSVSERNKDEVEVPHSQAASAFIRLLHVAPEQPELELRLEDAEDSLTAAFLEASSYVQAHQGVHRVQLFPEDSALSKAAEASAEATFELNLEAGIRYTVAVTADPQDRGLQLLLFADESESQNDRTKVRLLHLATGGPVDVMVRNGGTLFRNVANGSASPYITLSPAELSLDLTEAGSLRLLHASEPLRLPAASAGTLLYGGMPPKLHLILDS